MEGTTRTMRHKRKASSLDEESIRAGRGIQRMLRITVVGVVLLGIILSVAGCSGSTTQSNEPIKAVWVTAQLVGDIVSIPASEVENSKMLHFTLDTLEGEIAFMAYKLGKQLYVRSNVCPPCWSIGFSLQKDILVCDTCLTTFEAKTGEGIEGACVDYPKAPVPYEIIDGNIVMNKADLIAAYQTTIIPG